MSHPVLMLSHNLLHLSEKCVASILAQDIPTDLIIVDNGSGEETIDWLHDLTQSHTVAFNPTNRGITAAWNQGARLVFETMKEDAVFIANNDIILPPWFLSELISYDGALVSGVSVDRMEQIAERPARMERSFHPDFSGFLLRREAWEKIGPFDERMVNYCSDCAYHIEAIRKGIQLYGTGIPFYHERSSTLNLAPPEEHFEMSRQADADRQVFRSIYGCIPGEPAYEEFFKCEMQ
jgi:GT2 family glycosyltransferase